MMEHKVQASIVAMSVLLLCGIADTAPLDERANKVDELFSPWDTEGTPGAVVAIIKDEKIIYQQAYGMADLERGVRLSRSSIFDIASISKQFVAMSILLLEEQGKLSVDDDIRSYLPYFRDYGQTITIRHMIHHTSGLRDYMDLMELAGMKWENSYHQSEIVDLVARQQALNNNPGEKFLYSNSGYLLLAEIIHKVSGQRLGAFTAEHIFKPLNMKISHFYEDFTRIVENRALSYSQKETGGYQSVQYIFDVVGDTGLLTSIDDLFLWDQNFYNNVLGSEGPKLIDRMLITGRLNSGEKLDYAFGLRHEEYRGLKVVRHGGGAAGYDTQLMRFPEQAFTVMVLSNLGEFSSTTLAKQVADIYLSDELTTAPKPVSTDSSPSASPQAAPPDVSAMDLHAYTGHYYSSELDVTYVVGSVDGTLTFRLGYSPLDTRLVPSAADSTDSDTWDAGRTKLSFRRDRDESVAGFNLSWGPIRNISFEKTR